MHKLISIDPGKQCLALAKWADNTLLGAYLSRQPVPSGFDLLANIAATHARFFAGIQADVAVVERMVHYPTAGRKDSRQSQDAKANDLLDLQAIGSYVGAKLATDICYVSAFDWRGTADEDVTRFRVQRALRPSPAETEIFTKALEAVPKGLRHNLYDAVGIGLHWHGRYSNGK